MPKLSPFKKLIQFIHLWLGMLSGIIVFIVAITGCIFTFHDELKDAFYSHRFVEDQDTSFVAPSVLLKKANKLKPDFEASMVVYNGNDRPATVTITEDGTSFLLKFDPYDGKLLARTDLSTEFFTIIEELHMYLLLPEEIGRQIVGVATIIFIIMLITGILLWWPKKKKHLKQQLSVKWSARWRRLNYDLHRVTGIYTVLIALIIAITGLGIAYEWMHDSFYNIANLGEHVESDYFEPELNISKSYTDLNPIDLAFYKTIRKEPKSEMMFVWRQADTLPIITGTYPDALHYDHQTNFQFHPVTGEPLHTSSYKDKSAGLKLQEMTYGLHTGQFFRLPGKIIAFLCSLFIASLPVSGFILWYGRKFKTIKRTTSLLKD